MYKEVKFFKGTEVKELLAKAVGGIYISRYFDVMTDYYNNFSITDDGLEISVDKMLTAKIPIQVNEKYVNYAIGGECLNDDTPYEEWEESSYFEYKFEIANYMVAFNLEEKGNVLTWEQFKELSTNEKYVNYTVRNIDGGSMCVDMNQCSVHFDDVDNSYFEVCSLYASMEIDKSIVDAIYNDSSEAEDVCFRIEFNNGMSDMTIEPEKASQVF